MHFNEEERTNEDATAAKKNEDATAADETCRVVLDLPRQSDQESSGVIDDKAAGPSVRKSSRERCQIEIYGIERSHLAFQNEPITHEEETASSNSLKWIKAMESDEITQ